MKRIFITFCGLLLVGCSSPQATVQSLPMPQRAIAANAQGVVEPISDTNDMQALRLVCDPVVGTSGYRFQQGVASGVYTNQIISVLPEVTFTNLPASGRVFFVVASFANGFYSLPSQEVTFSSWGCILSILNTNRAEATLSLSHPIWKPFALPWIQTNSPGSLFVRSTDGSRLKINYEPYPNP
jgi:hypothetical protein